MKLSEIKKHLATAETVNFRLPSGEYVPEHFHVTEVGLVTKHFVDCGGAERFEKTANFQLWNADDFEHRLKPQKLLKIISISEKILGDEDLEIEVEYQSETIGKYDLAYNGRDFELFTEKYGVFGERKLRHSGGKTENSSERIEDAKRLCAEQRLLLKIMEIRSIERGNFDQVAEIYRQGIETGFATFQTNIPDWKKWDENHLPHCRIAAFKGDKMIGWTALTSVSSRCVYAGVAEVSIYVAADFRGQKVGEFLLNNLINESERAGFWTLQSGIFSENVGSIRLHEKCGFRQIGYREKIGQKNGVWKDNIIMERRSKIVGI